MRAVLVSGVAVAAALIAAGLALPAQAQCRQGSGPDMGDGIPYCSDLPPPPRQRPAQTARWHDSAAAVAWGDGPKGDVFIGVERYVDEQMAADAALAKCTAKGWRNCSLAGSITNGVIAVGADSQGRLRLRIAADMTDAKSGLLAKCAEAGLKCKVLKVYDGRPQRF